MIVFDVDGTLIGGETTDWASFDAAIEEVAGLALERSFYENLEEVTAQAIVHKAFGDLTHEKRKLMERSICEGYLKRLKLAHEKEPSSFPAQAGARDLLADLKKRELPVAIATGDWFETITFKLRAAAIPFDGIPMVTSSDFHGRADIIAGAVAKTGRPLREAVYIGDGLWDLRACQKLGIPFIGVGHRKEELKRAGAAHTLNDLSPENFWPVMERIFP